MSRRTTREFVDAVRIVVLSDGRRIHLDDIETAEIGRSYLDDLDATIGSIEGQLVAADSGSEISPDPNWRPRAELALKRKRRIRPRLQHRIGELTRAERQLRDGVKPNRDRPEALERRIAFIDAAEELLERDLFVEIWERAREKQPMLFADVERVS